MPLPEPVFMESLLGYDSTNSTTTGFRSRWSGGGFASVSLVDIAPHRLMEFGTTSLSGSWAALLDRPILDGRFCWHTNLSATDIGLSITLPIVELRAGDLNTRIIGATISEGRIRIVGSSTANTLLLSNPGSIPDSAVHSVVIYGVIHPTEGELHIEINGAPAGSVTGINTRGSAPNDEIHYMGVRAPGTNSIGLRYVGPMALFDDAVSMMPSRFRRLRPNSDGSPLDFTRSSGSTNFERVNNEFYNGPGFVSSGTVGHTDTYGLTDLVSPAAVIYGIAACANVHKLDAGTRFMDFGVVDNAVEGFGEQYVLPASRVSLSRCIGKSPDTNDPFTFAQINALDFRMRIDT